MLKMENRTLEGTWNSLRDGQMTPSENKRNPKLSFRPVQPAPRGSHPPAPPATLTETVELGVLVP